MTKRKSLAERWDSLPKEVKVLPYIVVSGAVVALIDYFTELEVNNAFWMGVINLAVVFLKQSKERVERLK
ncbi:MAG: hypothetical protein KKH97_08020 [Proteobacteria bacterium]|nr:hypothetical protein [Pseudomonadota bacterium]